MINTKRSFFAIAFFLMYCIMMFIYQTKMEILNMKKILVASLILAASFSVPNVAIADGSTANFTANFSIYNYDSVDVNKVHASVDEVPSLPETIKASGYADFYSDMLMSGFRPNSMFGYYYSNDKNNGCDFIVYFNTTTPIIVISSVAALPHGTGHCDITYDKDSNRIYAYIGNKKPNQ